MASQKVPLIPYPGESVQHCRCVCALRAILFSLELIRFEDGVLYQLKKGILEKWKSCRENLKRRKLSQGAKRDMEVTLDALARKTKLLTQSESKNDSQWLYWGACMWASLTLLEDCRSTCPKWFKGPEWMELLTVLTQFCDVLEQVDDRISVIGTQAYESAVV